MKRLFFGLFAAGIALSASAFTTLASKPHFATVYYVLTNAGTYIKTLTVPDATKCQNLVTKKCYLGYATDQGPSFPSNAIPSGATVQSANKGLYIR